MFGLPVSYKMSLAFIMLACTVNFQEAQFLSLALLSRGLDVRVLVYLGVVEEAQGKGKGVRLGRGGICYVVHVV